jgi:hypothetical protein
MGKSRRASLAVLVVLALAGASAAARSDGGTAFPRRDLPARANPAGLSSPDSRPIGIRHRLETNPIALENALPGSRTWQYPPAEGRSIEGYFSQVSAAPREHLQLHVSTTPSARYRVELYRLGWYGGAGARLVACLPGCSADEPGSSWPVPAPNADGEVEARWPVTDSLVVGRTWVSGYYIAKLVLTSGPGAGTAADAPLIVRAGPLRPSAILVQAPVNTWEAYNSWGGKSLYYFNSAPRPATHVSFDRPYAPVVRHSESLWSLYEYELPLLRFLEREGYDVSYTTDLDVDRDPAELLRHRLVISAGHDEYWTKRMRDGFERARALGTNLAFVGADDAYWQVRYENGDRTLVGYKDSAPDPEPDPSLRTTSFRDLVPPRPECQLIGVEFESGIAIGRKQDYTVAAPARDPWLANTGLTPGVVLPGVVGYEWDGLASGCNVPNPTVLFGWQGVTPSTQPTTAEAVRYRASSGARVFSAGSLQFAWALDAGTDDLAQLSSHFEPPMPSVQHFFRNVLADLSRPAPPASVRVQVAGPGVRFRVGDPDPRVTFDVYRRSGPGRFLPQLGNLVLRCEPAPATCVDRPPPGTWRYAVVAADAWGASEPYFPRAVVVLGQRRRLHSATRATVPAGDLSALTEAAPRLSLEGRSVTPTRWLPPQAPGRAIEGYSSTASITQTQRLSLHVSTSPSARYRIEVYRLGWYGGRGALRVECLPGCDGSERGTVQPVPPPDPATGEIRASWPVTDRFRTTRSWVSGYYIAELILTSGSAAGSAGIVPFVVRSAPARASRILVVAPVNTWQAYNAWGGKSLYLSLLGSNPKDYAHAVSFDRPYDATTSRTLLYWEYPLVRFLERYGYDVSYTTDIAVDRDPAELQRHRLVIIPGHSEYWTKAMRDAAEAARDAGTNLAFIGGNDAYWQARYADDRRTLLEFRASSLDPEPDEATKTVRFRDLQAPRPECTLVGVEWQGGWESDQIPHSFAVDAAALGDPWFKGTGFTATSTLDRLVGYEWDAIEPGCSGPTPRVFFHYEGAPAPPVRPPFKRTWYSTNADVVAYTAPSGARVFATGSIQFSWGLDGFARSLPDGNPLFTDRAPPDPRLQRFMRNVLDDLSGAAASPNARAAAR